MSLRGGAFGDPESHGARIAAIHVTVLERLTRNPFLRERILRDISSGPINAALPRRRSPALAATACDVFAIFPENL